MHAKKAQNSGLTGRVGVLCQTHLRAHQWGYEYTVVDRAAHAELTLTPRRATSRRRCFGLGLRCGRDPAGPCRLIVCFRGLGIPTRPSGILIRGPLAQLSLKGLRLNKRTPIRSARLDRSKARAPSPQSTIASPPATRCALARSLAAAARCCACHRLCCCCRRPTHTAGA